MSNLITDQQPIVKKPHSFDYSEYELTYNRAIDMCMACVGYHRKMNLPLKALHLQPRLYDLFQMGMEVLMKREIEPGQKFVIDAVDIERGSRSQHQDVRIELYPLNAKA